MTVKPPYTMVMAKPMKYRDLTARLRALGCTPKQGRGDHEKWYCPCGEHMGVITQTNEVSPGVVGDTIKRLSCLPEGWVR